MATTQYQCDVCKNTVKGKPVGHRTRSGDKSARSQFKEPYVSIITRGDICLPCQRRLVLGILNAKEQADDNE